MHARVVLIALLLLILAALSAAPAVAVAPSVPQGATVARLTYTTATEKAPFPFVWISAVDGREPKRLGPGSSPLLAPDGQSVAAALFGATANSEEGPSLAVYSALGAPVPYLNLATATATPLAWSADSRYLAVALQSTSVTNIAKLSGLAVIDTTTGVVHTIAHGQISGASFAPDGSDRIAYAQAPSLSLSAPINVYVSAPDGSGRRALTRDGRSLNPVWGSHYIAFDRERLRKLGAPIVQIWLMKPSGAGARQITRLRVPLLLSGLVPLVFSGDGSRLLAEYQGEDTDEAWTVVISSRRTHRLSVHGQPVMAAGLSRDGRTVLIDEKAADEPPSSGRVAQIPFAGGRSTVLVAHGAQGSWNH